MWMCADCGTTYKDDEDFCYCVACDVLGEIPCTGDSDDCNCPFHGNGFD